MDYFAYNCYPIKVRSSVSVAYTIRYEIDMVIYSAHEDLVESGLIIIFK